MDHIINIIFQLGSSFLIGIGMGVIYFVLYKINDFKKKKEKNKYKN